MNNIEKFESLLENGNDNALLRYGLGNEYLKIEDYEKAILHLKKAVDLDPNYSAAWKSYAKALAQGERFNDAKIVYQKGIEIAEQNGDKQAAREMQVFLKRLNDQ